VTQTRSWPIPQAPADGLLVHHVSDTHIGYRDWSFAESDHMRRDVQQGLVPIPDAFVHTGDIGDGTQNTTTITIDEQDAYARPWLNDVARGAASVWSIGNHDIRDRTPTTRQAWEAAYGRLGNSYTDVKGWRIITFAVDTHSSSLPWVVPDTTWDWVDSVCSTAPGPVVLAQHYPPWELTTSANNFLEPSSKLDSLMAARTNITGMLCGHMHYELDSAQMTQILTIGGRKIPVICDISSMLSLNGDSRDQSAQIQSTSVFVEMTEGVWRVHYRQHGSHAWSGPGGQRVTTMDISSGTVTHSM
jgi:hypothetical protein